MANQEHLNILKLGVDAWNNWRDEITEIKPDLSEAYLFEANLSEADLHEADLHGATLRWANLSNADLSEANLSEADLSHGNLAGANLNGAILNRANLSGAYLNHAKLRHAKLGGTDLRLTYLNFADLNGADLSQADAMGAHIPGADLSNANLSDICLIGADLTEANLSNARLKRAGISQADLHGAKLDYSDFTGADLSKTSLQGADLTSADFAGADLRGADLRGANFGRAILDGTDFEQSKIGWTEFGSVDLSSVKGLETVGHLGPSSIGIDTIYKSRGNIPESFLRDAGVPDIFIEYMTSLVGQTIEFYSCFISYSNKDDDFARKLHGRMRQEGLRVWFAPEDVKGGQKLYDQIDRAIQLHDRLLLILSENSIDSEWVMTEIRRAREVEIEENRRKLFPIRLVDFPTIKKWKCFDADIGKDLAKEVREYYIPDFSNWKDHDSFEAEFAKLLRDLRAQEKRKD